MGIPSSAGDGNDVASVYKTTQETISDIRVNGGPRFLEFETYRWREHCGPNFDNDIGYRTKEEFLEWKKKDPLKDIFENKDLDLVKVLFNKFNAEIQQAHHFADNSEFPSDKDFQQIINS